MPFSPHPLPPNKKEKTVGFISSIKHDDFVPPYYRNLERVRFFVSLGGKGGGVDNHSIHIIMGFIIFFLLICLLICNLVSTFSPLGKELEKNEMK